MFCCVRIRVIFSTLPARSVVIHLAVFSTPFAAVLPVKQKMPFTADLIFRIALLLWSYSSELVQDFCYVYALAV